ncbi:MAG: ROK family protein [Clostridia bacterium]|nr:ROK family protein [Clostridia bacterium]
MQNSRKETLKSIFSVICDCHPVSRREIAEKTGVSLMSVCNAIETLSLLGLVNESPDDGGKVGRRAALLSPADGEYLILDMTRASFEILLFSLSGETLAKYLYMPRSGEDFFSSLCRFTGNLTNFINNKVTRPLIGAGILFPGRYDRDKDAVIGDRSGNYENINLGTMLFGLIPCPFIEVEEDLTMGASDILRSSSVTGDTVYVKTTYPCGAALITGGKLLCGSNPGLPGLGFDPITADREFAKRYFDNISLFSVADMAARSIGAYLTLVTPERILVEYDPLFPDTVLRLKIYELLRENYLSPHTQIPEISLVRTQLSAPVSGLSRIIVGKYLDRKLDRI